MLLTRTASPIATPMIARCFPSVERDRAQGLRAGVGEGVLLGVARREPLGEADEVPLAVNGVAVDGGDDVAGADAGLRRREAVRHGVDERAEAGDLDGLPERALGDDLGRPLRVGHRLEVLMHALGLAHARGSQVADRDQVGAVLEMPPPELLELVRLDLVDVDEVEPALPGGRLPARDVQVVDGRVGLVGPEHVVARRRGHRPCQPAQEQHEHDGQNGDPPAAQEVHPATARAPTREPIPIAATPIAESTPRRPYARCPRP